MCSRGCNSRAALEHTATLPARREQKKRDPDVLSVLLEQEIISGDGENMGGRARERETCFRNPAIRAKGQRQNREFQCVKLNISKITYIETRSSGSSTVCVRMDVT